MITLRVLICIAISSLIHHSVALGAQQWTEGAVIDRSLNGFKDYPFTLRLNAFESRGYKCGELYPTSESHKCESPETPSETFLGNPAKVTVHLTEDQDIYAFIIKTKLSYLRVESTLEESLGKPFSLSYEVRKKVGGLPEQWIAKVWIFKNGGMLDLASNGSYIEFLRYTSPKHADGFRKDLLLQFPYLHKFLPPLDKNDL